MSDVLHEYLEHTWGLMDTHISESEVSFLKKLFQHEKNKMDIIDCAYKKIKSLSALPDTSEACAKLILDILLAEALEANQTIALEKQTLIFNAMVISLQENELLIQKITELLIENRAMLSFSKALSLIRLTLSLAAAAAAVWFTGPYCALTARYLFSRGYIALHGEPSWAIQYSYFIPAQEWIGNLAFTYGPKLLAVPTALGSARLVDTAMQVLNHTQKVATYFYNHTLTYRKNIPKEIPETVYKGLACYL